MQNGEVAIYDNRRNVGTPESPSLEELKTRLALLRQALEEVLEEGIDKDYGIIPGTKQRTLLQPGAQKLMTIFHLVPEHSMEIIDLQHPTVQGHREYRSVVSLYSQNGVFLGKAPGSCNTMEAKYRYRGQQVEMTDVPVPKDYWDARKKGEGKKAQAFLGGEGRIAKKNEAGEWVIAIQTGEKVEHDNPADYYNTCEKISYKRACVNIVKWVTAASALFPADEGEMEKAKEGKAERKKIKEPVNLPKEQLSTKPDPHTWNNPDFAAKVISDLESCPDTEKVDIRWKELWGEISQSPDKNQFFIERDRIRKSMEKS